MVGGLEKILSEQTKTKLPADNGRDIKTTVLFASELELSTKLFDYGAAKNLANIIRNSPYKIDRIVINGGMPYVANRYSKQKGEYIDLLEDRIYERYGKEIYEAVKGKYKGRDGGVDSMDDAFNLGHYALLDVLKAAYEKNIPIDYVISDKDYNNVLQTIITTLEKVQKAAKSYRKNSKKAAASLTEIFSKNKGVDQSIISLIEDNDEFGVSKWKNKDKTGIKDVAVRIYNTKLMDMLTYSEENRKNKVIISNNLVNRFEINGVKFNVMHAVNGRYNGNSFVTPLINGQKRTLEQVRKDYAINHKTDDVYVRTHESMLDFTATEVEDSKPIWLLATPPFQDLNALTKRSESWGKSVDSKRLDQPFDTGIVMFSVSNDGRAYIRHMTHSLIKSGVDPFKIEDKMKKIVLVGDTHIGAPSSDKVRTAYELLEATPLDLAKSKIGEDSYALFLGDLSQGGIDKATRSDIIDNKKLGYTKSLERLISDSAVPDYQKTLSDLRENLYSVSIQNLGAQLKDTYKIIGDIAKLSSRMAFVNGNHVAKAALHANEADIIGGAFEHIGGQKVDYPDELRFRGDKYEIFGYKANALHTTGYRGGRDGGRANMDLIYSTGTDAYLQFSGDEHMLHLNIALKKDENGDEKALIAAKPFAYQDYTSFERDIIKKGPSPRGYAALYVPEDSKGVGTKYVIFEAVPETALDYTLKVNGGSDVEKLARKSFLDEVSAYLYQNDVVISEKMKRRIKNAKDALNYNLSGQ